MEIGKTLKGLSYLGIGNFVKGTAQWLNKNAKKNMKKKKKNKDDEFQKVAEDEEEEEIDMSKILDTVKPFTNTWMDKARKKH